MQNDVLFRMIVLNKMDCKLKILRILPTTLVWELGFDEIFRNWAFSDSRMLQLLVVHKHALIDDEGSLWVLWSSHFSVTLIGVARTPNLYEREKHSLYEPEKYNIIICVSVRFFGDVDYKYCKFNKFWIVKNAAICLPNSVEDFFHRYRRHASSGLHLTFCEGSLGLNLLQLGPGESRLLNKLPHE